MGIWKIRMSTEMQTMRAKLMRFQRNDSTPVTGLEANGVMLWQSLVVFHPCSEMLKEPKFKSNRLSCLVQGIS